MGIYTPLFGRIRGTLVSRGRSPSHDKNGTGYRPLPIFGCGPCCCEHCLVGLNWFGFITGPCEQERLKAQCTAQRTISMADSLTVGLTPYWEFSACYWEMNMLPSIRCLCNLYIVPWCLCSPKALSHHQQIIGYLIQPFWLVLETSICKHFHFPTHIVL